MASMGDDTLVTRGHNIGVTSYILVNCEKINSNFRI